MKRLILLTVLLFAVSIMGSGVRTKYVSNNVINTVDTLNDTASGSGFAEVTDTIGLVQLYDGGFTTNSIILKVILEESATTTMDYGESDSAWMQLFTTFGDEYHILTADTFAALPCTLRYIMNSAVTASDTILKEDLRLAVFIHDTLSDTNITAEHIVRVKYLLKDE